MTNVKIYKNRDGIVQGYEVKGHAGYDDYGKDIVCAAISVLAQTGIFSLKKICNLDFHFSMEDGYLEVVIPREIDEDIRRDVSIVLDTILIGIESIRESYPDYITILYEEV